MATTVTDIKEGDMKMITNKVLMFFVFLSIIPVSVHAAFEMSLGLDMRQEYNDNIYLDIDIVLKFRHAIDRCKARMPTFL